MWICLPAWFIASSQLVSFFFNLFLLCYTMYIFTSFEYLCTLLLEANKISIQLRKLSEYNNIRIQQDWLGSSYAIRAGLLKKLQLVFHTFETKEILIAILVDTQLDPLIGVCTSCKAIKTAINLTLLPVIGCVLIVPQTA